MIVGSVPCTLASFLLWHLTMALEKGQAVGQDVGFDVIGVVTVMYAAFLIALGSCLAGLLYFGFTLLKTKLALKTWHKVGILYSLAQVTVAVTYLATR